MPEYDAFPDIEAVVAEVLRDAAIPGLARRVYSTIPKRPTYPLVTIERGGGLPAERHRLDAPVIQVNVWGTSKSEARDIAAAARVAIFEAEGTTTGIPMGVISFITGVDDARGLTWAPDPTTKRDKYEFSVTVYAHV